MSGTPKKNLGEIADATQLQVLRAKKNSPEQRILLAMTIDSDIHDGGSASPGSISRRYESVGNPFVYPYFKRFSRTPLRGHGFRVKRVAGECAGFA